MFTLHMSCQTTLLCKLMVTLVTSILDTLMFGLNMNCQTTLCCKLLVALITSILDTLMFGLNMNCQTTLCCKLLVALITSILETFIYRLKCILSKSNFQQILPIYRSALQTSRKMYIQKNIFSPNSTCICNTTFRQGKLRQGSGKDGQGMAFKAKGLEAETLA